MAKSTKGAKAPSADVFAMMEEDSKARVNKAPSTNESKRLTSLAVELYTLTDRVEKGEQLLSELKKRIQAIQTKDLVDLMDEIQQDVIGLPEQDADVRVYTKYHASLPALPDPVKKPAEYKIALGKRTRALKWLKKDGHDGLIRVEVVMNFPRGEQQRAAQIAAEMQARVKEYADSHDGESPYSVEVAETVNWNSLTTLVKSLTEDHGRTDLPLTDLGASIFRFAEIKKRTERKKK